MAGRVSQDLGAPTVLSIALTPITRSILVPPTGNRPPLAPQHRPVATGQPGARTTDNAAGPPRRSVTATAMKQDAGAAARFHQVGRSRRTGLASTPDASRRVLRGTWLAGQADLNRIQADRRPTTPRPGARIRPPAGQRRWLRGGPSASTVRYAARMVHDRCLQLWTVAAIFSPNLKTTRPPQRMIGAAVVLDCTPAGQPIASPG